MIPDRFNISFLFFCLLTSVILQSCNSAHNNTYQKSFQYKQFRDSILHSNHAVYDTTNVFDGKDYIPDTVSPNKLFTKYDTLWQLDANRMNQLDTLIKGIKNQQNFTAAEKATLRQNIRMLDSFLASKNEVQQPACFEKDCNLFVAIDKSKQKLYLYFRGELLDSFNVSTGRGKRYETPEMSLNPRGPTFIKYRSKKYPLGNYMGLGNMPYAVFIKGGYAIHGTTPGNFARLGTKASHGCIRLHPDNAIIFYELVKTFGLSQTWVTVRDSL